MDTTLLSGFVILTRERNGTPSVHRNIVYPTKTLAENDAKKRLGRSWIVPVAVHVRSLEILPPPVA